MLLKRKTFIKTFLTVLQLNLTSNYLDSHPLLQGQRNKISSNKKVSGMFKDEVGGEHITELVGLRSQLYSYKIDDKVAEPPSVKRCKGIKKL